MPHYKSGGQIDSGIPIFDKFGPEVASAASLSGAPTPQWTYICGSSAVCKNMKSSVNTMRTFTENGQEKVATTFSSVLK